MKKIIPEILLIIFSVLFFLGFFFPNIRLFVTPQGILSDAAKFHYPIREFYQQKIHLFQLPFWSKNIGMGFPLIGQSEIAAFNPLNFITLFFFNFETAINLQLLVIFILLSVFSYYFAKTVKLSTVSSIYFAILFTYSSIIIFNLDYFSPLNSWVYFPLIALLTIKIEERLNAKWFIVLIITLTMQIFSGHFQIFFLSGFFVFSYAVINVFIYPRVGAKLLIILIVAYILSILLAAFQILPSIEYLNFSSRQSSYFTVGNTVIPLKLVLTIFNPFIFGDPKTSIAYINRAPEYVNFFIGYIPLLIAVIYLLRLIVKKHKFPENRFNKPMLLLFILAFSFGFGVNSPFYFLTNIPPFSYFRFPNRFFVLSIFILCFFSSLLLEEITKKVKHKTIVFIMIFILLFIEKKYYFKRVNDVVSYKNYIANTLFLRNKRIYTSASIYSYYVKNIAEKKGPFSQQSANLSLELIKNTSAPDYNLLQNNDNFNYESGIRLLRDDLISQLIEGSHSNSISDIIDDIQISTVGASIIRDSAINDIISISPILSSSSNGIDLSLIKSLPSSFDKNLVYYYYKVNNAKPRVQFYNKYILVNTFSELNKKLDDVGAVNTVLLENDFSSRLLSNIDSKYSYDPKYSVLVDKDEEYKIKTKSSANSILVLADRYYPGWRAYIDGKETKIYKANFLFRGIYLPKGNHVVQFKYIPQSFYTGIIISLMTLFSLLTTVISGCLKEYLP